MRELMTPALNQTFCPIYGPGAGYLLGSRRSRSGGGDKHKDKENVSLNNSNGRRNEYEWVNGLKFNVKWPGREKRWYGFEFKKQDPEG